MTYVNPKALRHLCAELYTVRGWSLDKIRRETGAHHGKLHAWITKYGWVKTDVSPCRVRYGEPRRTEVLGTLAEVGSLAEVARRTLIPKRTIGRWRDAKPVKNALPPTWRCYCSPYGVTVTGDACHLCHHARAA